MNWIQGHASFCILANGSLSSFHDRFVRGGMHGEPTFTKLDEDVNGHRLTTYVPGTAGRLPSPAEGWRCSIVLVECAASFCDRSVDKLVDRMAENDSGHPLWRRRCSN
eukprot:6212605-Pleurochrysis_carterae.AAC.2